MSRQTRLAPCLEREATRVAASPAKQQYKRWGARSWADVWLNGAAFYKIDDRVGDADPKRGAEFGGNLDQSIPALVDIG